MYSLNDTTIPVCRHQWLKCHGSGCIMGTRHKGRRKAIRRWRRAGGEWGGDFPLPAESRVWRCGSAVSSPSEVRVRSDHRWIWPGFSITAHFLGWDKPTFSVETVANFTLLQDYMSKSKDKIILYACTNFSYLNKPSVQFSLYRRQHHKAKHWAQYAQIP